MVFAHPLIPALIALLFATGSAKAQIGQDALVKRALMERQQQIEENVLRLRQSQQLYEAQSRGASTDQLRELETEQIHQRAQQQSLNDQQRLRIQTLPQTAERNQAYRLGYEAMRAQRERDEQRWGFENMSPRWSPSLEPVKR